MPNTLTFYAPNYQSWDMKITENDGFKDFIEVANGKDTEYPAPAGWQYRSLKFPFKYNAPRKMMTMKMHEGQPLMSIEEFLEHPTIDALVTDRNVINEILYFTKPGGTEITEAEAFENSRNIDASKKPPSRRPGKRDADAAASAPPETPTKSSKSAA